MSDSISAMYDDYDEYKIVCKYLKIKPLNIMSNESFYNHQRELFNQNNVKNYCEFYIKFIKA